MNELPCEVVRDLLPSYVDGLTSETTNRLVDGHVEGCEGCRAALDAMRAPSAEPAEEGRPREIDYLRKNRRHNRAVVLWSLSGALLLAFAILAARLFVVGEEGNTVIPFDIQVDGNRLSARLMCVDSIRVVSRIEYEENDGVVTLRTRCVLASFLHGGEARAEYTASEPIRQVRTAERVFWDDGVNISTLAANVYETRHDYVGDMPANGRTANALNLSGEFGPYENELQTSQTPYRWTIRLQTDLPADRRGWFENRMDAAACVLLATVGNLDEVSFAYTSDGEALEKTVTAADASALLGRSVKDCADSPRLLHELLQKTGFGY